MLKLNKQTSFSVDGKKIAGVIVGIDKYSLVNFEGKKIHWVSYTLTSEKKGVFSRFWITDWKKDGWVLWTNSKKKKVANLQMVTSRSGISEVQFSGEQGVSTPFSGVAVFAVSKDEYYAMESFTNSEVLCLKGQKVARPKETKQPSCS